MKNLKFCYEKTLFESHKTLGNTQKAVWQKSKYWNKGQTIRIYFINGSLTARQELQRAYGEIASYTSLNFIYTTNREESDIRVSFNAGWGSYSYLGTDAKFIPKSQETMNIGWRGMDVCRHEALHSIGALHEHQNPNEGIDWDDEAVIADLSGAPNYWNLEEIRFNVLDKIDKATVDASNYDPKSVMLYYFPASWTKNGVSSNDNPTFSATDIEFMKKIYAPLPEDDIAPVLTLTGDSQVVITKGEQYMELGASATDNIDGNITDKIIIEGIVDTSTEGLYYKTYTVTDKAGNTTQKIRTIMVQTRMELKLFLQGLFPTKNRLSKLTEIQLIHIAESLGIEAYIADLKSDTLEKVWSHLEQPE